MTDRACLKRITRHKDSVIYVNRLGPVKKKKHVFTFALVITPA